MALKIESYSTHDNEIETYLFKTIGAPKLQSFIFRMLSQGASVSFLRFVARYLVKQVEPVKVKELLNKYTVTLVYNYLKNRNYLTDDLLNEDLDNIFKDGITVEKLLNNIENDNLFSILYNGNIKKFGETINEIKKIIRMNKGSMTKRKEFDNAFYVLYNFYDYFQMKTEFAQYEDNRKSYDILIAEAVAYHQQRNFEFNIIDKEEFYKNIIPYQIDNFGNILEATTTFTTKSLPKRYRNSELIFGHLINDAIVNKLPIEEVVAISSSELKCYTLDDGASFSGKGADRITFIKCFEYQKNGYHVNLDKVFEFNFEYNGEKYKFTQVGIRKI